MLSVTAKHYVIDMPDGFTGAVVHPPSWFVSIDPSIDGSTTFTFASRGHWVATRCESLPGLASALNQLKDFDPGLDTAVHRSYHLYDFWFSTISTDLPPPQRVRLCLNDCADVGREPPALSDILGWFADRVRSAGASLDAVSRLSLWARPPQWSSPDAAPGTLVDPK